MKVLVISHMYPSSFNKISGVFVHEQVKALKNIGCEVKVVSPIPYAPYILSKINKKWKAYRDVPYKNIIDSIEVYHPRYLEFPKGILFHQTGNFMALGIKNTIKEIYKEFKFDIIHSNVALPDGYSGMVVNKEYNVPHVITIHGQDFQNTIYRNDKCKEAVFKALDSTDSIITVSNKLKRVVEGENFYKKIVTINNGIDKNIINKNFKGKEKTDKIKIVSVSNLKETKGIQYNLYAIAKLLEKYKNIQYDIVGDGEYKNELINIVNRLNINYYVNFLGKKDNSQVINILRDYDIFSLPSYREGFGVVYLEAMAQGLPVIGVKGEGIEDAIIDGYNGFLVERQNSEMLADVLKELIDDENKRIEIGKNAIHTVENKFTWENNAKEVFSLYKQLIKNKEV